MSRYIIPQISRIARKKNTEYVLTFNALRDNIKLKSHNALFGGERMKNNIAFKNLKTQMAIKEISIKQIAKAINVNRDTAGNKLSRKSPITLKEAFLIKNNFFHTYQLLIFLKS